MAAQIHPIPLGALVRERFSGYEGKVTAVVYFENGCIRYEVQSKEMKDGRPVAPVSFDVQELEMVAEQAEGAIEQLPTGGPLDMPALPSGPGRREVAIR